MDTTARSPRFPASLDGWLARLFGDREPKAVGSGWPGGVVAVLAGALALGGVLCLRFPATLTAPSLRPIYPLAVVRAAIGVLMALAFSLGAVSAILRRRKVLGATAIALDAAALALGGPAVPLPAVVGAGAGIGLDWFLLNALIMTAVFVPLERLGPRDPGQRVFRRGWSTDAVYTFIGHASIQVVSALVVIPGELLRDRVFGAATLGRLPLWAQLPLVLVVADLAFYWIHRAAHHVPAFWRLHRLHHSSERMDWLASERLHLAEIIIVRAGVLVPLTLLGFTQTAILAYVTFASFHAVFIHANFRPSLRWLEPVLMTPRLHHLHHATDADAIDKNFAVHLPILDRLFGTLFAPKGRWPSRMGVVGFRAPDGYWGQQASVFARAPRSSGVRALVVSAFMLVSAAAHAAGARDRGACDELVTYLRAALAGPAPVVVDQSDPDYSVRESRLEESLRSTSPTMPQAYAMRVTPACRAVTRRGAAPEAIAAARGLSERREAGWIDRGRILLCTMQDPDSRGDVTGWMADPEHAEARAVCASALATWPAAERQRAAIFARAYRASGSRWEIDPAVVAAANVMGTFELREELLSVVDRAQWREARGYDRLRAGVCTDDGAMSVDRARACATLPAVAEDEWQRHRAQMRWVARGVTTFLYASATTAAFLEPDDGARRDIATVAGVLGGVTIVDTAIALVATARHVSPDDPTEEAFRFKEAMVGGMIAGGIAGGLVAHSIAASPRARGPVTAAALAPLYVISITMTFD
ncbi:MAG TPA: sterol desaturase family protein [Polyangia bacterium]